MGEHKVGDAAVGVGVDGGVEEAVEGHGEGDEVLLVAVAVGEGEGEVKSPAALDVVFVDFASSRRVDGAGEGLVVEDTYLEGSAVFAEDEAGTGLEVVATEGHVEGLEAEFLALVVDAGVHADVGGHA